MLLPIKLAIRAMALSLALIIGYLGVTGMQVWMTSRQRSTVKADAIIVFGSAEYDGRPSPDLEARLEEALALYQAGRAPVIAVTGSKLAGDTHTEAGVSAATLEARGVPASAIVVGGGSDTYENVDSVAAQLKERGVETVLVVTDPFHEDRAMAIVSTFGLSPSPDPTTDSPITRWGTLPYFVKETFAVAAGRIFGYGLLSSLAHPGT
jgi:uncharacterized SAM-binding protein YcdF (DUF218 family)